MTDSMRIDKWLWHARFFKTRTLAQAQVTHGRIRVNSTRIEKANHTVKIGDVLTFVKGRQVKVIEILVLSERRGPAKEAQLLYRDLSPAPPPTSKESPDVPAPIAERPRGSGRPTKRERRQTEKLREEN